MRSTADLTQVLTREISEHAAAADEIARIARIFDGQREGSLSAALRAVARHHRVQGIKLSAELASLKPRNGTLGR